MATKVSFPVGGMGATFVPMPPKTFTLLANGLMLGDVLKMTKFGSGATAAGVVSITNDDALCVVLTGGWERFAHGIRVGAYHTSSWATPEQKAYLFNCAAQGLPPPKTVYLQDYDAVMVEYADCTDEWAVFQPAKDDEIDDLKKFKFSISVSDVKSTKLKIDGNGVLDEKLGVGWAETMTAKSPNLPEASLYSGKVKDYLEEWYASSKFGPLSVSPVDAPKTAPKKEPKPPKMPHAERVEKLLTMGIAVAEAMTEAQQDLTKTAASLATRTHTLAQFILENY